MIEKHFTRFYYFIYFFLSLFFFVHPPTLVLIQSLKASDFDEFDGVYADLDEENYGPIRYKQASIYQYMKFKKNNQK